MDASEITARLGEPFDPSEVKFKPAMVKNNRALAMAYVDARVIQDRLDDVLGVGGWQDEYSVLPDGSVVCRLRVRVGDEWVTKEDVGSPSEQPDAGDRLKASFSDALKRAAVKYGIGRYLYRIPASWWDYDPVKRQFSTLPRLPDSARPAPQTHVRQAPPKQIAAAPAGKEVPLSLDDLKAGWQGFQPADGKTFFAGLAKLDRRLAAATGAKGYLSGDVLDGLRKAMGWGEDSDPAALDVADRLPLAKAWVADYLAKCEPRSKG